MCLSGASVSEIAVKTRSLHAADIAFITVKPAWKTLFLGAVRTAKQKIIAIQQVVIAHLKL